ncbi:MAG: DUF7305 domain-containing protein [Planctomycetota bacterium]|jgi:cytoskeletal protein CcmA (bactofilin family)
MNRKRNVKRKRKGSALCFVIIALLIAFLMGASINGMGLNRRLVAARTASQMQAKCAADAGIVTAIFNMSEYLRLKEISPDNPTFPTITDEPLPNCDSVFSYKINSRSMSSNNEFRIHSIGQAGQVTRNVYALVTTRSLFDSAIAVLDRISLMPNTLITGYNSDDPSDTDNNVKIGTVSIEPDRIPIGPGTVIDGDVFVGVDGDPSVTIGAGGTITGDKYALTEEVYFPTIIPPPLPVGSPIIISAERQIVKLDPSRSAQYSDIIIFGKEAKLEISGDVVLHITGDLDMGNSGEINILPDSSLVLYVDGNINAANTSGFVNQSGDSSAIQIFGTSKESQTFIIKAKSDVFGAIYAPNANVEIYAKADMYGSITAKNVTMKSGSVFYYDEALRNADVDDEGAHFVMTRWSEYETFAE